MGVRDHDRVLGSSLVVRVNGRKEVMRDQRDVEGVVLRGTRAGRVLAEFLAWKPRVPKMEGR